VRTLVAHEPPVVELLPDSAQVRAQIDDIYDTYRADGADRAMQKFMAHTGLGGAPGQEADGPRWEPSAQEMARMRAATEEFLAHLIHALEWLLATAQERGPALAWTGRPDDDELDPTLYSGTAGTVLAFLEGYQHFRDDRYARAAARGARTIIDAVSQEWELSCLYLGLAGMAFALRAVHDMLADSRAGQAAVRALDLVRSRFDGERWSDQFELLKGNAGIALGAAQAGDLDLAVLAVTPYLAAAEPTAGGVHWEVRTGSRPGSITWRTARSASSMPR